MVNIIGLARSYFYYLQIVKISIASSESMRWRSSDYSLCLISSRVVVVSAVSAPSLYSLHHKAGMRWTNYQCNQQVVCIIHSSVLHACSPIHCLSLSAIAWIPMSFEPLSPTSDDSIWVMYHSSASVSCQKQDVFSYLGNEMSNADSKLWWLSNIRDCFKWRWTVYTLHL